MVYIYVDSSPYMLHTRIEEKNTRFFSYSACSVHIFTLNMYVSMAYTGGNRILVVVPQEYVNTYSTRRFRTCT